MDFSKFLDIIKLSNKHLFGISLMTGLLLFLNERVMNKIGLADLVDKFRGLIGILFLVSISMLTVNLIHVYVIKINNKIKNRKIKKHSINKLKNLTQREKDILSIYIKDKTRTTKLSMADGVVSELQMYGIIFRLTSVSQEYVFFDYNIQPWAWDYLNKHPYLIE